jgi:hypothetical protein
VEQQLVLWKVDLFLVGEDDAVCAFSKSILELELGSVAEKYTKS